MNVKIQKLQIKKAHKKLADMFSYTTMVILLFHYTLVPLMRYCKIQLQDLLVHFMAIWHIQKCIVSHNSHPHDYQYVHLHVQMTVQLGDLRGEEVLAYYVSKRKYTVGVEYSCFLYSTRSLPNSASYEWINPCFDILATAC